MARKASPGSVDGSDREWQAWAGEADRYQLPEDRIPDEWIEALTEHESRVRRVRIQAKKGTGSYFDVPHGSWARVNETPTAPASEHEAAEREPGSESPWAREMATRAWRRVVEFARSDGPNIDSRILLEEFSQKSGAFVAIKGGIIVKRCHLDAGPGDGDPVDMQADFLRIQNTAIRDRDAQLLEMARTINYMGRALGDSAIARIDQSAMIGDRITQMGDSIRADNQSTRDFIGSVVRTEEMGKTIRHGIDVLGPDLAAMFAGWATAKPADTIHVIAGRLIKSITAEQIAALKDRGLGDLWAELSSGLTAIAAASDHESAVAIARKIAPQIAANQTVVRPLLTEAQAGDVLALLRVAGLVS